MNVEQLLHLTPGFKRIFNYGKGAEKQFVIVSHRSIKHHKPITKHPWEK